MPLYRCRDTQGYMASFEVETDAPEKAAGIYMVFLEEKYEYSIESLVVNVQEVKYTPAGTFRMNQNPKLILGIEALEGWEAKHPEKSLYESGRISHEMKADQEAVELALEHRVLQGRLEPSFAVRSPHCRTLSCTELYDNPEAIPETLVDNMGHPFNREDGEIVKVFTLPGQRRGCDE